LSKERAQRRAARIAAAEADRAARERSAARRAKRKAVLRAVTPRRPDRRTGRLAPRRSRFQRITITLLAVVALAAIWWEFDDLATRIALTALVAVAGPALIVLTLDRR
jgi:Flp pilus assembly protein TadB